MNEGDIVQILHSGFYAVLLVAGPTLLATLAVGLLVGVLQALTQVQEMTLANVPKIVVALLAIMLFLPLSFAALRSYFEQIAQLIITV